jgi:hypothetical protein
LEEIIHFSQGFWWHLRFGGDDQASPVVGRRITKGAIQAAIGGDIPGSCPQRECDGVHRQGIGALQIAPALSEPTDPVVWVMGEDTRRYGSGFSREIDEYVCLLFTSHG